jgi:catechol 2,3-dioxygenase-like lactoylglutathione lyase family enzyme
MIIGILQTTLLVRDYDEAIAFYCGKLGFVVTEDTQLSNKRWVRILPPGGQGSEILLSKAVNQDQTEVIGKQAAGRVLFFMSSDNLENDYKNLLSLGVEFTEHPRNESYGKVAVFKDLYGNRIDLIQQNK